MKEAYMGDSIYYCSGCQKDSLLRYYADKFLFMSLGVENVIVY